MVCHQLHRWRAAPLIPRFCSKGKGVTRESKEKTPLFNGSCASIDHGADAFHLCAHILLEQRDYIVVVSSIHASCHRDEQAHAKGGKERQDDFGAARSWPCRFHTRLILPQCLTVKSYVTGDQFHLRPLLPMLSVLSPHLLSGWCRHPPPITTAAEYAEVFVNAWSLNVKGSVRDRVPRSQGCAHCCEQVRVTNEGKVFVHI